MLSFGTLTYMPCSSVASFLEIHGLFPYKYSTSHPKKNSHTPSQVKTDTVSYSKLCTIAFIVAENHILVPHPFLALSFLLSIFFVAVSLHLEFFHQKNIK